MDSTRDIGQSPVQQNQQHKHLESKTDKPNIIEKMDQIAKNFICAGITVTTTFAITTTVVFACLPPEAFEDTLKVIAVMGKLMELINN